MRRGRSTTVCFASKAAADESPLLNKPNCEPEVVVAGSLQGVLGGPDSLCTEAAYVECVSIQGWRKANEDAMFVYSKQKQAVVGTQALGDGGGGGVGIPAEIVAAIGVFDGHRNSVTARFLAERLVRVVAIALAPALAAAAAATESEAAAQSLTALEKEVELLARDAFVAVDAQHRTETPADKHGGSTAAVALATSHFVVLLSTGDARLFAFQLANSRGADSEMWTLVASLADDHRVSTNLDERRRVAASGASCANDRVNGVLGVSRAFGDYDLKPLAQEPSTWPVISAPAVACVARQPRAPVQRSLEQQGNSFSSAMTVVVGCDGVWELQPNPQELVAKISGAMHRAALDAPQPSPVLPAVAQQSVACSVRVSEATAKCIPPGCDNVTLGVLVV